MSERSPSVRVLWLTWAALLALLGLTWLAAQFNLGVGNIILALFISGLKMALVLLIFTQVRYKSKSVWVFASAGFVWWLIFMSLILTDYLTRWPVTPYSTPPGVSQNANH